MRRNARWLGIAVAASCVVAVVMPTEAWATTSTKRAPKPGLAVAVQIQAPTQVYLDEQTGEKESVVVFNGVDSKTRVSVDFGDGSGARTSKGRCTVAAARRNPSACTVTIRHDFGSPGSFTITAAGGRVSEQQSVTVVEKAKAWKPPAGTVFNEGWKPFRGGATYRPCQTVTWYFDRSGEHPDRNTMIDDVRSGLAILAPLSGLTFTEVTDPADANLTFRWGDLAAEGYPNAAGYGGYKGPEDGFVAFSTDADWTLNKWSGKDWRRLEWPRPDLGPGWYSWKEGPGRVVLVIHEVMHAMGFDHVEDFTSVMYPQGGIPNNRGDFSAGDLAGLRTMYLDNPCPTIG